MTDALLREMERVIFEAHSEGERDGTADFDDLLELRTTRLRQARQREEEAIATLSDRIGTEREKETQITTLATQVAQKKQTINAYINDRNKLVPSGSEERVARLNLLTVAADKVRRYLRFYSNQEQTLLALQDDVSDFRQNRAPEALRRAKETFAASDLTDEEWRPFHLQYAGDVDRTLAEKLKDSRANASRWRGQTPTPAADAMKSFIGGDANPENLPLAVLEAEIERLQRVINVDKETASRYAMLTGRIVEESTVLERLTAALTDCQGAGDRAKQLHRDRESAYFRVFEAVVAEQNVLRELYRPLMERLGRAEGTLRKLSFTVSRYADVKRWAEEGEKLFDLRRQGPFKGRGTLEQWAEATLKQAWEKGDPAAVSEAMKAFRHEKQSELLSLANVPRAQQSDYRAWLKRFAKWCLAPTT
jgi:hypothetical protein